MIKFVTGIPGQGKTLYTTKMILETRKTGRQVYANFHSRKGLWDFALWEDMMNAENALCVVDEAQMWFNSRSWKDNTTADLAVFQQSRKNGLDLIIVVQNEARVDVGIRELAAYHVKCQKLFDKWIVAKTYVWEKDKPLSKEFFRIKPSLFNHYFTQEIIGERDGRGYRFGALGNFSTITNGKIDPTHYRVSDVMTTVIVAAADLADALAASLERTGPHDRLPSFTPLLRDGREFFDLRAARPLNRWDIINDSELGNVAAAVRAKLPAHWLH